MRSTVTGEELSLSWEPEQEDLENCQSMSLCVNLRRALYFPQDGV